jgi:hypothetical protein
VVSLFISPDVHDCLVERLRLLQGDVDVERLAHADREQLNLVCLRDRRITARQGHELLAVVIHRAGAPEQGQLPDWVVHEWRPEADLDELDEAGPVGRAIVELQTVVPQLGVVEEMQRRVLDPLVLRRAAHREVAIALIEPW